MTWIGVIVVTMVAVAAFLQTPYREASVELTQIARKSLHVIFSRRISDHWKERVLPCYAGRLFKASVILFFCLLVLVVPVGVGDLTASLWSADLLGAMASWQGFSLSLLTASVQLGLVRLLAKKE